jgi:hypothetical protein
VEGLAGEGEERYLAAGTLADPFGWACHGKTEELGNILREFAKLFPSGLPSPS